MLSWSRGMFNLSVHLAEQHYSPGCTPFIQVKYSVQQTPSRATLICTGQRRCTWHSAQCIWYSAQCIWYSVQCIWYSVECIWYIVQCTVKQLYSFIKVHYSVQLYSLVCTTLTLTVHCTLFIYVQVE